MIRKRAGMHLTAAERILLHLAEFPEAPETFELPAELSLEGVSSAVGIEPRHLAQLARPLLEDGLVAVRKAHVRGSRQRRKVYELTADGQQEAHRLRDALGSWPVAVRDAEGFRETTLAEVLRRTGPRTSLLRIVRRVAEEGILDLEASEAVPSRG